LIIVSFFFYFSFLFSRLSPEKGFEYEFRLAARNAEGHGQESIAYITTPDGPPTGPPTSIKEHTITPDILVVEWDPPEVQHQNGRIIGYTLQFHKKRDDYLFLERNVTNPKVCLFFSFSLLIS
jgi:netrin-G3 ligand